MKELTIEITNFCEEDCPYCSSDAVKTPPNAYFLDVLDILPVLEKNDYDVINISGGEPLTHPNFYNILKICEMYTESVVVYTNALRHIKFNANVIDGVTVEANLTLKNNTEKIHILKRVQQGREVHRPEVQFSSNWDGCEDCDHVVMRKNGKLYKSPCRKWEHES